jgi:hypothetical protein
MIFDFLNLVTEPSIVEKLWAIPRVRIPSDGDQRSEVMAIRDSDGKPITFRQFSER